MDGDMIRQWAQKALSSICLVAAVFFAGAHSETARAATDQLGRVVQIPAQVRRIVSLAPSITEILFALGGGDRVKGVTRFSNFPPEAETLPKVGSYVHLDLEKIVALKPDLCIAVKDGNPKDVIDRLDHLGIPVYAVDPQNLEAVKDTILEIGALLDIMPDARSLVREMDRRIRRITSKTAGVTHQPTVFFQIGISPIVSAGTDTFIHELITLSGGINLAQGPVPYPRFSREQILALSPEVFIITSMARGVIFERIRNEWRRWPQIPAVKKDRIHLIDSDLVNRASPRLVKGLEILARLIHPTLFRTAP